MGRIFQVMFFAGLAGLIAWAITEPFAPPQIPLQAVTAKEIATLNAWNRYELAFMFALGSFIAMTIAGLSGYFAGSRTQAVRGGVIGFLLGGVAAVVGGRFGGLLANRIFGEHVFEPGHNVIITIFARTVFIAFFGAMIGLVQGVPSKSWKRCVQGLIGGALGGRFRRCGFRHRWDGGWHVHCRKTDR